MKRTETFGDNPFKVNPFQTEQSEIRVLALLRHASGKRSHGTFYVTKCSRGVTKREIACEIKKEMNQSGIKDKIIHVLVK